MSSIIMGATGGIEMPTRQAFLLEIVHDRVMALYTMSFIGMLPVGSLLTGSMAHITGVEPVFAATGIAALAIGYALTRKLPYLRDEARPVPSEKGLLS